MKGGPARGLLSDERGDFMEIDENSPPSGSGKRVRVNVSSEGGFGTVFSPGFPSEALYGIRFRESVIPEGVFGSGLREHVTGSEFHPSGAIFGAGSVPVGVPPRIRPAMTAGISMPGPTTGGLVSAFSRRIGVGERERPRSHFSAFSPGSETVRRGDSGSRATTTGSS